MKTEGKWEGPIPDPFRVVACGLGVQSTAILELILRKDPELIAKMGGLPHLIVFADPGSEGVHTYAHMKKVQTRLLENGLRLHVASKGSLARAIREDRRFSMIPAHTGGTSYGMMKRNCTLDYKVKATHAYIKAFLGMGPRQRIHVEVQVWIGISLDEIGRVRGKWFHDRTPIIQGKSVSPRQTMCYPLIELNLRRLDCYRLIEEGGWGEVPKSACVFCPFKSNRAWRELRDTDPAGWQEAVELDAILNTIHLTDRGDGEPRGGIKFPAYLHPQRVPLPKADLGDDQGNLFDLVCGGFCGT